ncbi:MAG: alpha/beta hydrolase [Patescibacteria group bacterium]|nr:alpha/beta hydrolase [Patescibacteria group bacterium]
MPTTVCDQQQVDFQIYGTTGHLTDTSQREDGVRAFAYGAAGSPFVSGDNSGVVTFNFHTLFSAPTSTISYVKLMGFSAGCAPIYGLGPAFTYPVSPGDHILTYADSGHTVTFEGETQIQYPSGNSRYIWIEAWDGVTGSSAASYSYLVDLQDIQNPVDDSTPPEPNGKRPVIIIPGMLGTELYDGNNWIWANLSEMFTDINDQFLTKSLSLDALGGSIRTISVGDVIYDISILDIFKSLLRHLHTIGYQDDVDVYYLPYDWRLDLETTKNQLEQKIQAVKSITHFDKVDIIAHSMGGLLAKDYLATYGKDDINKLIFVGTPHLGSPKAAKVLLEGDRFSIPWLEEGRMQELSENSISAYELLPTPKYFNQFTGYIRKYGFLVTPPPLDYNQTKDFLLNDKGLNGIVYARAENLFSKNLQDLDFSGIDVYNIAGCKTNTQAGYYMSAFGNIGHVAYTSGDGTVPVFSADYLGIPASRKYYVKNANHSGLPSTNGVVELIAGILSDQIPSNTNSVSTDSSFCNFKGKEALWRSPVEVHIYDSLGRHTGPAENNGIEYNIPGVGYDVIDGEKFVFLPTDEGQSYQIQASGQATSTFDLLLSDNDNGQISKTHVFNDVAITPKTLVSFEISDSSPDDSIVVDKLGNGEPEAIAANAQLDGDDVNDLVPPQTTTAVSGISGQNGWYTSDVAVTLSATDDGSGVLQTLYSLDDGSSYSIYTQPITITATGTSQMIYYSVDKAGNNETPLTLTVRIDKFAPELIVVFDISKSDFVFNATDDIDPAPAISCTSKACALSDTAGNTRTITFQKTKLLTLYTLTYKTTKENSGQQQSFPNNLFLVNYITRKQALVDFNQTEAIRGQEIARIDYDKRKDVSNILELSKPKAFNRYSLPGTHFLKLQTKGNNLSIKIE